MSIIKVDLLKLKEVINNSTLSNIFLLIDENYHKLINLIRGKYIFLFKKSFRNIFLNELNREFTKKRKVFIFDFCLRDTDLNFFKKFKSLNYIFFVKKDILHENVYKYTPMDKTIKCVFKRVLNNKLGYKTLDIIIKQFYKYKNYSNVIKLYSDYFYITNIGIPTKNIPYCKIKNLLIYTILKNFNL
ncbi:hypothetical protein [Candidatus Vidania fulgoroideorum]